MSVAHLLRLAVVRVVVAGREHVGAEQDAARHLGAEAARSASPRTSRAARRPRRAGRTARRRSARGCATPRPARRCSRRGSRGRCAAATRRASRRRARAARSSARVAARADRADRATSGKYSFGRPIDDALQRRASRRVAVVGHRRRRRDVESQRIVAGDDARGRAPRRRPCAEDADLIERRRERDEPVAAHAAVRRLHADDAAERRRLPHRAAGLGAERDARRCPAATAAAEPPDEPPGTRSGASGLRVGPYALFSVDEPIANSSMFVLPTMTAPASRSRVHDGRLVRADVALEDARAAGRRQRRASRCCP